MPTANQYPKAFHLVLGWAIYELRPEIYYCGEWRISMNRQEQAVPFARALVIFDALIATLCLFFVLPHAVVPGVPDHYWNSASLGVARWVSGLLALMLLSALASLTNRRAPMLVLTFMVGVLSAYAFVDLLRLVWFISQEVTSERLSVSEVIGAVDFWIDLAIGIFPIFWFTLHWKLVSKIRTIA